MNAKVVVMILGGLLLALPLSAQRIGHRIWGQSASWKLSSVDLGVGVEQDMLKGMTYDYFVDNLRNPEVVRANYPDMNFQKQDVYSMICENPHLRLGLSFASESLKNTELRVGLLGIFNRIDGISYYNSDNYFENSEYVNATSTTNELAGEIALLKTLPLTPFLRVFGGAGTNLGFNFANHLTISSSKTYTVNDWSLLETGQIIGPIYEEGYHYESFGMRSGIQQRAFLQGGFGATLFRKLELGLETRLGMGYRYHFGGTIARTQLRSFAFTAKWMI
jgi:hypothetical protein